MADDFVIRAVIFREGEWLVAQCLDYDIAAQAKSERELQHELARVLLGRVMASEELGVEPFEGLPPAPKRYWDMFSQAQSQPKTFLPFVPPDAISHTLPAVELKAA